jgi:hypothetical protein
MRSIVSGAISAAARLTRAKGLGTLAGGGLVLRGVEVMVSVCIVASMMLFWSNSAGLALPK